MFADVVAAATSVVTAEPSTETKFADVGSATIRLYSTSSTREISERFPAVTGAATVVTEEEATTEVMLLESGSKATVTEPVIFKTEVDPKLTPERTVVLFRATGGNSSHSRSFKQVTSPSSTIATPLPPIFQYSLTSFPVI